MKIRTPYLAAIIVAVITLFAASTLYAEESKFRKRFIRNYEQNRFKHQSVLIKKNKDKVPAEVAALMEEAKAEPELQKRLYLLDLANTMATMHMEWNKGSPALLVRVEELQKIDLDRIKKKEALVKIRQKTENTPGNFVMDTHADELEKASLAPVIYPHWVHRSFYRCKVCHTSIFQMKLGTNEISHKKIDSGELCGKCHDGGVSFDAKAKENCSRCHTFNTPEAKPLIDLSFYNGEKFEAIAKRVGSTWDGTRLPDGKFPLDRLKQINWVKLDDSGVATQLSSINHEDADEGLRDTRILFDVDSTFMKDVIFSHKIHTPWVRCSLCHPGIFTKELGANSVSMLAMKDGVSCGTCHGRVSFTYKDCKRCHMPMKAEPPPKEVLRRPAK